LIYKIGITLSLCLLGFSSLNAMSLSDPMKPQLPSANSTQTVSGTAVKTSRKKFPSMSIDSITIIGIYRVIQINGTPMEIGDTLRGAKLIDILENRALFLFQGKQYQVHTRNQKAKIIPLDSDIEGTE